MAFLNSLEDVNALLAKKGIQAVKVDKYDLTVTEEMVQTYGDLSSHDSTESSQPLHQLLLQAMDQVIEHYKLDEVEGFYEADSSDEGDDEQMDNSHNRIRQGVYYQVLNQKQILWEFFKHLCHQQKQTQLLTQFDEFYVLALNDVDQLSC